MIEKLYFAKDLDNKNIVTLFMSFGLKINEIIELINSLESMKGFLISNNVSKDRQGKDSFPQEKQLDVVKSQPAVCDKHDIIRRLSEDGFFMDCGDFVKKEVKHENN